MHPHKFLLDEFQIAINHFVPTVSDDVKQEAQKLHDDYLANESVSREEIKQGMMLIGKKTFALRNAYHDFVGEQLAHALTEKTLSNLEVHLKEQITALLTEGSTVMALMKDSAFEEKFGASERRLIEGAYLDAKKTLMEQSVAELDQASEGYQNVLLHWQEHQAKIEAAIMKLLEIAQDAGEWQDEIEQKVEEFGEGFLVTERDPELEEITQAIIYWSGVVKEGK